MAGRTLGTIVAIFLIVYFILLGFTFATFKKVELNIDNINYNTLEIISTKGIFTDQLYNNLEESVNNFGDYKVIIKYEKQIKPGVYDIFYNKDEIINRKFKIGDKISIFLEDKNLSPFGKFINASFMGLSSNKFTNSRVKSIKSTIVSRNGE